MHPVPHRCQLCNKSNTQKRHLNKHKTISLRQEKLTDGSKNKENKQHQQIQKMLIKSRYYGLQNSSFTNVKSFVLMAV